jgi:hypothetical protein
MQSPARHKFDSCNLTTFTKYVVAAVVVVVVVVVAVGVVASVVAISVYR